MDFRKSKASVVRKSQKLHDSFQTIEFYYWNKSLSFLWGFPFGRLKLFIFRIRFLKNRSLCRAWNYTGETTINVHPRMITEKWPSEKRVWHLYCTRIRFYHNEPEFQNFVHKLWDLTRICKLFAQIKDNRSFECKRYFIYFCS